MIERPFHARNELALVRRPLDSGSLGNSVVFGRCGPRPDFATAALWSAHGREDANLHGALLDHGDDNVRLRVPRVNVHFGYSSRCLLVLPRRQRYGYNASVDR